MNNGARRLVPMDELSPLIVGLIDEGFDVTLTVTGNSMRPMLTHLRDSVVLTSCDPNTLKVGDIPLYRRECGTYVLHRIIKVHNDVYDISGDHQWVLEKGVPKSQVLCVVKGFTRNGEYYSCDNKGYKLYSFLWRKLFVLRKLIMTVHGKLHRLFFKSHKSDDTTPDA